MDTLTLTEKITTLQMARFLARLCPPGSEARRLSREAGRAGRNHADDAQHGSTFEGGASLGPSVGIVRGIARRIDFDSVTSKAAVEFSLTQTPRYARRMRADVSTALAAMPATFTVGELTERILV